MNAFIDEHRDAYGVEASDTKWERLTAGSWQESNRPQRLPVEETSTRLAPRATTVDQAAAALRDVMGAETRTYRPGGIPVEVDAATLAAHLPLDRSPFYPAMIATLERPQEIWMSFERHSASGQVVLRSRIVRALRLDRDRTILFVANARAGRLEGWTFVATRDLAYINRQRSGLLVFSRD